jgi:hypothetical protein
VGTPEEVSSTARSYTGKYLVPVLAALTGKKAGGAAKAARGKKS